MARSGQEVVLRDGFEGPLGNPRRLGRQKMNETLGSIQADEIGSEFTGNV